MNTNTDRLKVFAIYNISDDVDDDVVDDFDDDDDDDDDDMRMV